MNAVLVAALWIAASVVLAASVASFIRASARRDVAEEAEAYLRALAHGRPRGSLVGVRVAAVVVVLGALVTVSYRTVGDLPRRLITAASAHADLIGGSDRAEPSTERGGAAATGKHHGGSRGHAAARTTPTTTRPGDAGATATVGGDATHADSATAEPAVSPTTTTTSPADTSGFASPPRTTTTTTPPADLGGFRSPPRTTTTTTTSTTTPPETTTTTTTPPETTTTTTPPETTTTTAPPPETTTTTAPPPETSTAGEV